MANQFGERVKQLREENRFLQRQLAASLDMDTPMLSKIERGERKARKDLVPVFAKQLKVESEELLTLWLADQLVEVVEGEDLALQAMLVAEEEVKYYTQTRK